jgi:signal recognition particle subunit SRP54
LRQHQEFTVAHDFTLEDFRKQLAYIGNINPGDWIRHVPGVSGMIADEEDPEAAFDRVRRILDAMTQEERNKSDIVDHRSRARIASTAGVPLDDVETFLTQFRQVRAAVVELANMSLWQRLKMIMGFGKVPGQDGGGRTGK